MSKVCMLVLLLASSHFALSKDICEVCRCTGSLVMCKSINEFPNDVNITWLRTLKISNSNLPNLFSRQLKMSSLTHLQVRNTTCSTISENALDLLVNLHTLDIVNTKLKTLSSGAFSKNVNLENLDLSSNEIFIIYHGIFSYLPLLKGINLSGNQLRNITKSTFIFNQSVRKLDISKNEINVIDSAGLTSLRDLRLGNNKISSFTPSVFFSLTALEKLDIGNNNLLELLPNQFSNMGELKWLRLSNNRIWKIHPSAFKGLGSLQEIFLDGNELIELGNAFWQPLSNLSFIDVSKNYLTTLQTHAFKGFTSLNTLDLRENHISSIEDSAFNGNKVLKNLLLQGNVISNFSCGSFTGLSSLTTLNLQGSVINMFHYSLFRPLHNLTNLYVSLDEHSKCDCEVFSDLQEKNIILDLGDSKLSSECTGLRSTPSNKHKCTIFGSKCGNESFPGDPTSSVTSGISFSTAHHLYPIYSSSSFALPVTRSSTPKKSLSGIQTSLTEEYSIFSSALKSSSSVQSERSSSRSYNLLLTPTPSLSMSTSSTVSVNSPSLEENGLTATSAKTFTSPKKISSSRNPSPTVFEDVSSDTTSRKSFAQSSSPENDNQEKLGQVLPSKEPHSVLKSLSSLGQATSPGHYAVFSTSVRTFSSSKDSFSSVEQSSAPSEVDLKDSTSLSSLPTLSTPGSVNVLTVKRVAVYSSAVLSVLILCSVVGALSHKVWLHCRRPHHVYEEIRMRTVEPVYNEVDV